MPLPDLTALHGTGQSISAAWQNGMNTLARLGSFWYSVVGSFKSLLTQSKEIQAGRRCVPVRESDSARCGAAVCPCTVRYARYKG